MAVNDPLVRMDVESNMGIDCGIKNWLDGGQGFILELTFSPSGKAGRITWGLDDQHQNNTPWQQMLVDDVEGGEEDTDRNNIPMAPRCQRWRSAAASTSRAGKPYQGLISPFTAASSADITVHGNRVSNL